MAGCSFCLAGEETGSRTRWSLTPTPTDSNNAPLQLQPFLSLFLTTCHFSHFPPLILETRSEMGFPDESGPFPDSSLPASRSMLRKHVPVYPLTAVVRPAALSHFASGLVTAGCTSHSSSNNSLAHSFTFMNYYCRVVLLALTVTALIDLRCPLLWCTRRPPEGDVAFDGCSVF